MSSPLSTNFVNNVGMLWDADAINATRQAVNDNTEAIEEINTRSATATVATSRTLNSGTFGDLTDTTDKVTVTVGPSGFVLVWLQAKRTYIAGTGSTASMTCELSGANTLLAANNTNRVDIPDTVGGGYMVFGGLAPGDTTFKMKYARTGGGTSSWNISDRTITAVPL